MRINLIIRKQNRLELLLLYKIFRFYWERNLPNVQKYMRKMNVKENILPL